MSIEDNKVDRGDDFAPNAQDLADDLDKRDDDKQDDDKQDEKVDDKAVEKQDDKDADKKADKKTDKKDDNRVPQSRVDEITRKNKAAIAAKDQEIEKLKDEVARRQVTADVQKVRDKIDELDDKYEELIADGKVKEAKEIRKELRKLQDVYNNSITTINSENASRAAVEQMRYDTAVAAIEAQYDELNPDHDDFDEDKAEEVLDVMTGLTKAGHRKAEALRRAVKYVIGDPKDAGSKKAADDADKVKEASAGLREKAVKRGLDAQKKQPADLSKQGLDSDKAGAKDQKVDVMKMTQAQFAKLDEEAKARLRGDEL